MTKLEAQIQKTAQRLSDLKERNRQRKIEKLKRSRPEKSRGRPRIDESVLIEAVKLAEVRTISDVCLKLDISRKTLTRYGITRQALERKPRC